MSRSKKYIGLGLLAAAVIAFIAVGVLPVVLWATARGGSAVPTAITSTPDGQEWTLTTRLNPDGIRIAVITDSNNQIVFTGSMRFSAYSRWFVHGGAGEFWIYSGDIGILHYARGLGGTWSESPWVSGPTAARMPRAFYSQLPDSSRRRVDVNSVVP